MMVTLTLFPPWYATDFSACQLYIAWFSALSLFTGPFERALVSGPTEFGEKYPARSM